MIVSHTDFFLLLVDELVIRLFQVQLSKPKVKAIKDLFYMSIYFRIGSGAYAEDNVGAAAATGDGDIMMRFLPSFLAIELMRNGATPQEAADKAIARIRQHHAKFFGGIVVMNVKGEYAAACNGMDKFPYTIARENVPITVEHVKCD